jgi:hypothetical protein
MKYNARFAPRDPDQLAGKEGMIIRLFRPPAPVTISRLYGGIVAPARMAIFYAGFGVADTVEMRS